jgi:RNA polymerase sigma-70 factor (ECF subfamily)
MKDSDVDHLVEPAHSTASLGGSLLVRLRTQDPSSWRQLWELFEPVVREWCLRAGLNAHDSADVVQEVFQSVARNLAKFRREKPGDTFRGWLWTITRNKIRDHWRARGQQADAVGGTDAQRRFAELPDELSDDWSSTAATGTADGLYRRALDQIKAGIEDRTWQAFWQTTVDERPAAEVAEALGMSCGAVYVAKSRVLARLREELGELLQ